jgi:hypothetical protein
VSVVSWLRKIRAAGKKMIKKKKKKKRKGGGWLRMLHGLETHEGLV